MLAGYSRGLGTFRTASGSVEAEGYGGELCSEDFSNGMTYIQEYASAESSPVHFFPAERCDDKELVRMAQAGIEMAFEELVRRHQPRVFALIRGKLGQQEDVEDVAQEVFLRVYLSIKKFDRRATFSTWIYRITVNQCWDYLRKKKVRPLVYRSDLCEAQPSKCGEGNATNPSSLNERMEHRELLRGIFQQLAERDRQLLVLKEMEGFSVRELAALFNLNANTIKVRLFRVRQQVTRDYR
jgi:RNA polymerase sigma-70 factor, ECF subfamily